MNTMGKSSIRLLAARVFDEKTKRVACNKQTHDAQA